MTCILPAHGWPLQLRVMGDLVPVDQCRECNRPLDLLNKNRPELFCGRWHQVKYWLEQFLDAAMS
ncbi:hypothetical protein EAO70_07885 [Streptomyces sp. adm13(2018)]|nr:hypothetical protein EAO70_07885 [Streptomyces sp. adm13(2018)]